MSNGKSSNCDFCGQPLVGVVKFNADRTKRYHEACLLQYQDEQAAATKALEPTATESSKAELFQAVSTAMTQTKEVSQPSEPKPRDERPWPELPYVDWWKWIDIDGFEHSTTIRAWTRAQMFKELDGLMADVKQRKGIPAGAISKIAERVVEKLDAESDNFGYLDGDEAGGIVKCVMLKVSGQFKDKSKPKLEFECDGLSQSISCGMGIDKLAELMKPIGMNQSHIVIGKKFNTPFYVKWTQDGKYKNVVAVAKTREALQ